MLAIIVSILATGIIAFLWFRQFRSNTPLVTHGLRLVAVGLVALVIAWLGNTAVATHRLMLGLGGAVILCEVLFMAKPIRTKGVKWIAETLPVIIPILFFMPYRAYVGLFFGYDIAIFLFALIVVICYLALSRSSNARLNLVINSILSIASITMLLWMTVNVVNGLA